MDHKRTSGFYLLNHKKTVNWTNGLCNIFLNFFHQKERWWRCVYVVWCCDGPGLVPAGGRKTEERWAGARDGIHPSAVTLSWGQPSTTTRGRNTVWRFTSAVNLSIDFHNHGEGPYYSLLTVGSTDVSHNVLNVTAVVAALTKRSP